MAYKSPTEINWSKGAGEGINYANEVTNSLFSNMFLVVLYILVFWGFYKSRDDPIGAFAVAGFSTAIISLIMWIGGWVSWITFAVCIALAIVGASIVIIDQK